MERKIGEIFQDGDATLKVVETTMFDCDGCQYNKTLKCDTRFCTSWHRKDLKSVKFIKQDQP